MCSSVSIRTVTISYYSWHGCLAQMLLLNKSIRTLPRQSSQYGALFGAALPSSPALCGLHHGCMNRLRLDRCPSHQSFIPD